MAEENNADISGDGAKRLVLPRGKIVPVLTTQGAFYARDIIVADVKVFNGYFGKGKEKVNADLKAFGELSLKTMVYTDSDTEGTPALTEEIYAKLTDGDVRALAEAVAEACDLSPLPEGEALEALGAALFDSLNEQAKRWAQRAAKINETLDKSFGALSPSVKVALGNNLTELAAIRDSLRMSPAVEALRKAQEEQKRAWAPLSGIEEHLKTFPAFEATQKVQENFQRILDALPKKSASEVRWEDGLGKSVSERDVRFLRPAAFEETAAGRAASRVANAGEESARQLSEVAGLVGQVAERVGELHQLVVTDVLPEWYKNLQDSSDATKRNLVWAKWALIASVVVTILMTIWQLWVAHDYELENDAHQKALVSLIQQQLEATQTLNERLTAASIDVKEHLARLNEAGASPQASKPTAAISLKAEKTP